MGTESGLDAVTPNKLVGLSQQDDLGFNPHLIQQQLNDEDQ
jgi:hypothetical protein